MVVGRRQAAFPGRVDATVDAAAFSLRTVVALGEDVVLPLVVSVVGHPIRTVGSILAVLSSEIVGIRG